MSMHDEYGDIAKAIEDLTKAYERGELFFEKREIVGVQVLVVKGATYEGRPFFKFAGFEYRGKQEGCEPQWRLKLGKNNVYVMSTLEVITHGEKVFQMGAVLGQPMYALNI